jgi:hypothetical protein
MVSYYSALPGIPTSTASQYQPNVYGSYQSQQQAANAANEARYQQGLGLWNNIVAAYKPGGSFGQAAMASYQQGKQQSLASAAQNLVSSGLYNSTATAGLAPKYEQQVGNQFRLNLADAQTQAYTNALQSAAQWIYNKNEQAPNTGQMAGLMKGTANRPNTSQASKMFGEFGQDPFATAGTASGGYYQGSLAGTNQPSAAFGTQASGTQAAASPAYVGGGQPIYGDYTPTTQQTSAVLNMADPLSTNYIAGGDDWNAALDAWQSGDYDTALNYIDDLTY